MRDRENKALVKHYSERGDKGDPGRIGLTGLNGAPGPKGDKGDKGDIGATRGRGPKGDTGATGPRGNVGPRGQKGDKGDPGLTGRQGLRGDPGPKGRSVLQGPKGDKGDPSTTIPNVSQDLSMNNHKITQMGTPTQLSDAATKGYVDGKVSGGGGLTQAKADGRYFRKNETINMQNNKIIGLADPTGLVRPIITTASLRIVFGVRNITKADSSSPQPPSQVGKEVSFLKCMEVTCKFMENLSLGEMMFTTMEDLIH